MIALFSLLIVDVSARAETAKTHLSLLLGDSDSISTIEAVRRLRADPALRDVAFHVYSAGGMSAKDLATRDLAPLRASKIVIVHTMGMGLAQAVAPEIISIEKSGGVTLSVGSTWDDKVAALGFKRDETLADYFASGGAGSIEAMTRLALIKFAGLKADAPPPPAAMPEMGAMELSSGKIYTSFEAYRDAYPRFKPGKPWVALVFYRNHAVSGQLAVVSSVAEAVERRGLNVIAFFGYPGDKALRAFAFDKDKKSVVAAIGGVGLKFGVSPETTVKMLRELNAPALNLITLSNQTRRQWESSKVGLDIMERGWQVSYAELGGLVAPMVVASKEPFVDAETGLEAVKDTPIDERVERAADRLAKLVALRTTPAAEKRIAIIYYNYPPGKENIGASYLNVLPKSLWSILESLKSEGYDAKGAPASEVELFTAIHDRGNNINGADAGALEERVRNGLKEGSIFLLPVKTYRDWLETDVPVSTRKEMLEKWGEPEKLNFMVWRDQKGEAFFVFPVQRFGNLLFGPQPTRGWEQDVVKLYHDVTLPPHHQYMAFYLWLQKTVDVHAMIHVGTHGTHEWHSGKEIGFTAADPGELFAGAVPQIYPYIVDNIGEALQAKRRGMAAIVSHMTPPLDKAALHPQLRELKELVSNLRQTQEKSPQVAEVLRADVLAKANAQGLTKDIGIESLDSMADLERLDDYIQEVAERTTPFGMHTFGVAPEARLKESTAAAVLAVDTNLTAEERESRMKAIIGAIGQSAKDESAALTRGLSGGYIAAGPGNDPVRNPDSLPTGRNLYGFDPARIPGTAAWTVGWKLAEDFVADFKARKNEYPTKVTFNLWGVETNRHEGAMEAQIMALMGIKPVWDARGKVAGLEVISREALGRPRVDVTMIPTGLYRDLFSQTMHRLDEAVTLAQNQDEPDNPMHKAVAELKQELVDSGIDATRAEKLARVRMFTEPTGAYGTNLPNVLPASNTYGDKKDADEKASGVFFNRMRFAFGQGLWSDDMSDRPGLGVDLLKRSLKGTQAVVHSVSSTVYGVLDNDDMFQYLGGTAMAARVVNGATPEVYVADMANPKKATTVTLERYLGREMRARYLNPKWIEAMMKEGYAGARFVNLVVEYLWGWQVLTPEAIGDAKWQEMYETWVADRNHLDIKEKFRAANNLLAYQAILDRMLVAINKGYWNASAETKAALEKANIETIAEAGVACTRESCSSNEVIALLEAQDRQAMERAISQPAPDAALVQANVGGVAATVVTTATAATSQVDTQTPPSQQTAAPSQASRDAPALSAADRLASEATPPSKSEAKKVDGYAMEEQSRSSASAAENLDSAIIAAIASMAVLLGFASRFATRGT